MRLGDGAAVFNPDPFTSDNGRSSTGASPEPPAVLKQNERTDTPDPPIAQQQRRAARIVRASNAANDADEKQRQRLLERLMTSQGRLAITRAAREYRQSGFEFPLEQDVQLQLLEHVDEELVRTAIAALTGLFESELPIKKPVLEQRLRRLEEYADEIPTREAAANLRRTLRERTEAPERRARPNP